MANDILIPQGWHKVDDVSVAIPQGWHVAQPKPAPPVKGNGQQPQQAAQPAMPPNRSVPLTDEQLAALPPVKAKKGVLPEREPAPKIVSQAKEWVLEEARKTLSKTESGLGAANVAARERAGEVAVEIVKKFPSVKITPAEFMGVRQQLYQENATRMAKR